MNCQEDECIPEVYAAVQACIARTGPPLPAAGVGGGDGSPLLQFPCRWCGKIWTSARARMMHEGSSHGRRSWCSAFVDSSTCVVCGKEYHSRSRVIRHLNGSGCGAVLKRGLIPSCDPRQVEDSEAAEAERARRARTQGIAPLAAWPPGPTRGGPGVFRFLREAERGFDVVEDPPP